MNPPPILFCLDKRECAAAGGRENRFDERAARMGRSFVMTGVGRIGPAGVETPVVPAPDRFREELRSRITTLGGGTGWKPEMACFYSRAFRFTRKGYAVSVRQQSCQRLRSYYMLPGRLPLTFLSGCRGGFHIRPLRRTSRNYRPQKAFPGEKAAGRRPDG